MARQVPRVLRAVLEAANNSAITPVVPGFSRAVGRQRLSLLQNFLDLRPCDGETVDVLTQPPREVRLNRIGPAAVDLTGRVHAGTQPGVTEVVAQSRDLRAPHDLLGQLWRDEDDAPVPSEHDIAPAHERAAAPD